MKTMMDLNEIAVLTKDGDKLIGIIVSEENVINNLGPTFIPIRNEKGIYLKRKNQLTFLPLGLIKSFRPVKPGEKEIDRR